MKCVLLGATRGCGLETLHGLYTTGATCHLLARSHSSASAALSARGIDPASPQIHITVGDATSPASMRELFTAAGPGVELIFSSIGGAPSFSNPFRPGMFPEHLCARAMAALLEVYPEFFPPPAHPRLVVISSSGLGHQGFADLPWLLKPLYGWLLQGVHADKEEMEKLVHSAAGMQHVDFNPQGSGGGVLEDVVIVRPAFLTNGERVTGGVRAGERLVALTVRRTDVGGFVVEKCLRGDEFKNRGVTIGY